MLIRCLVFATLLLCQGNAQTDAPADLADTYLQAILQDDWETARACWSTADLAAADRLGITYIDLPLKLDSASLLVLERRLCRSGEIAVTVAGIAADTSHARIRYELRAGEERATVTYHAATTAEGWRFVSPATTLSADWPRTRTEYLDLRIQPPLAISETALRRLDAFVAETCARLDVPAARMDLLRTRKLGYYLCDEATVAEIVGAPTRGVALLQTDAVATSELCHLHELAHLLVNFALRDLPLYTLPVMQEGAAVALGGRWGRAPDVMGLLGRFTLREGFLDMEDLFTWDGFNAQSADLTYAPSGLLIDFLLDRLGGERFLSLYRRLSGELAELRSLDETTIEGRILAAAERDRQRFRREFDAYMEAMTCGGIQSCAATGGEILAGSRGNGCRVAVYDRGPWLEWVVEADGGSPAGAVLVTGARPAPVSRLFEEHFPGRPHAGEQMALIFSPEEVGLYDFHTDLLLAKYVAGFCATDYISTPDGGRLAFRIGRDLFPSGDWQLSTIIDR